VASLLDVNVLVALLVPTHEHHTVARQWVVSKGAVEGWATCPLTPGLTEGLSDPFHNRSESDACAYDHT
jgi:hypothetical protein